MREFAFQHRVAAYVAVHEVLGCTILYPTTPVVPVRALDVVNAILRMPPVVPLSAYSDCFLIIHCTPS